MREAQSGGRPFLVLREAKPVPPPPGHTCVVKYDQDGAKADYGMVIQCDCGKRYKCRKRFASVFVEYVWVRRLLPWPPRQKNWPAK